MTRDHSAGRRRARALTDGAAASRGTPPAARRTSEWASARKRRECELQRLRCCKGLFCFGDGPDHDDSSGPGVGDLRHVDQVNAPDREPRPTPGRRGRCVLKKTGADRFSARFGRCGPHRPYAEIIGVRVRVRFVDLVSCVCRQSESHVRPKKCARRSKRQIVLAQMQDRAVRGCSDVCAIVYGPQFPVPLGSLLQNIQDRELWCRFEGFVAELDDVNSSGEGGIDEVGEVALEGAGISAQVELR